MEGPGPCPRGGSSLKTDSRPGTADSSLSAGASPPGPSGFARPPPAGREPVFEMARRSLGSGDARGCGYPRADRSLFAMRDQVLDRWLGESYYREFDVKTEADAYRGVGVPRIRGRYRRCASQQGNALYFLTKLGIADGRVDALVEGLLHWQWPDGVWNCDRNPSAGTSSFWESRHAMLGLALHADRTKD